MSSKGSAAEVVQRTNAPWSRACVERDWDALLAMCDPEAVFMPPGAPAVSGGALRPWLGTFPSVKEMSWSATHLEEDGDERGWLRTMVIWNSNQL